jgi:hypothetical protein
VVFNTEQNRPTEPDMGGAGVGDFVVPSTFTMELNVGLSGEDTNVPGRHI